MNGFVGGPVFISSFPICGLKKNLCAHRDAVQESILDTINHTTPTQWSERLLVLMCSDAEADSFSHISRLG